MAFLILSAAFLMFLIFYDLNNTNPHKPSSVPIPTVVVIVDMLNIVFIIVYINLLFSLFILYHNIRKKFSIMQIFLNLF